MSSPLDTIAYQWKAVLGAGIVAAASAAQILVNDPTTAPAIQAAIPEQFAPLIPLVPVALLLVGTISGYVVIYWKKNAPSPTDTSAVAAVDPDMTTQMIGTINSKNSGEFTGVGAQ